MKFLAPLAIALPALAWAANPAPGDFASGYKLAPQTPSPVQELELPDALYGGVLRTDLGDLRVFNASGLVVPHALCPPFVPPVPMPIASEQPLMIFPLAAAKARSEEGRGEVHVKTADGTEVEVIEPGKSAPASIRPNALDSTSAYVIDAGAARSSLQALRLNWRSADGASEVQVRVEASDDLDAWTPLVSQTTLLRSVGPDGSLERARIALPSSGSRYLRIERSDGGPPPHIDSVIGETTILPQRPQAQPRIVSAMAMPAPPEEHGSFWFDSRRLAPVETAFVELPMSNMALQMALDSRASAKLPWQQRWSGEVSSVTTADKPEPGVLRFGQTQDRYWRLRVLQGLETLGDGRPALRLGYAPARLRFLTQGSAPFMLAFGSARIAPATPMACDQLFGNLAPADRKVGLATMEPGLPSTFGGDAALTPLPPPPEPKPVRQIVLWAILIVGALVLAAMAMSLLRRLREPQPPA